MLLENGHQSLLQEIARRYNQPEITDAINALLALDPLDNHPTKIPALPAFYQPSLWTRPVLKANAQLLPDNALLHLGEMLRFPQEEALYPGLLQVKDACTSDSLAEFAWDLFTAWQTAGAPSKESWAFTALGVLGNDDIARKLTPLIRAWPGESQHKRATVGLDILAAIGSDIALMQLNGIAQKLKFKALQERAKEKIANIAKSRELTVAELEDRLAPDLGLDDNGSLMLDFGPRQFTVSFDETLKPFVRDASGSRLKDLPKPNKSDDESQANDAVNRYKLLKKDARTVAAQQVARLESAMCLRRRWSPENFLLFLVEHPLIRYLTRRLIWGVYSADNQLPSLPDAVTGCYLTPYSEKRLDVLAGYLSGMPAPVWQNWCWQLGLQQAGEQLLKTVLTRLRQRHLPASTADMAAAHLHAMALAQLRGHALPLRSDWLDALAGSLIKEALNAPLPWSYRGVIHPDTDPILLTLIDALAGDGFGRLAPSTPQPPLPKDVTCELERTSISLPAELALNRFTPDGLAQSQVLHRLAILEIPGIVRQHGSTLTLAGNGEEQWKLTQSISQHAALIEAACFGATLQEAARNKLEVDMLDTDGISSITACLSQVALAGLASFSQQLLEQLTLLIAQENQFSEMGQALEVLYALWRLDEISGMQGAQIL